MIQTWYEISTGPCRPLASTRTNRQTNHFKSGVLPCPLWLLWVSSLLLSITVRLLYTSSSSIHLIPIPKIIPDLWWAEGLGAVYCNHRDQAGAAQSPQGLIGNQKDYDASREREREMNSNLWSNPLWPLIRSSPSIRLSCWWVGGMRTYSKHSIEGSPVAQ